MKKYLLSGIIILVLSTLISSCTKKIPFLTWTPPIKENIIGKLDYIVIVNPKKGDSIYDSFEDSLREVLSSSPFVKVESSRSLETLMEQLKDYNLNPKISDKGRVGFLSYQIDENMTLNRISNSRISTLNSCNYLRKKNKCRVSRTATIHQGSQKISYSQSVKLSLNDKEGNGIIPSQTLKHVFNENNLVIPDELLLRHKVSQVITKNYIKQILPYKEWIDIELLGGDSISIEMIEKGGYEIAFKRLERLISEGEKTSENLYLQGVVLEFEGNLVGSLELYNQSLLLDNQNEVIQNSLQRLENALSIKK